MTDATILLRVRKLLKLAENNPSPEEAAAAAARAQQLIDKYQLSTMLLQLEEEEKAAAAPAPDEPIQDFGDAGAPLLSRYTQRWQAHLGSYLCRQNGCKMYQQGKCLQIIGRPSDAETVRYLYALILPQVEALAEKAGRGMGITWRNNFRLGVVETIGRRLREQRQTFEQDARRDAQQAVTDGQTLALVHVNTALARIAERRRSVDEWTKANVKLRAGSGGGGSRYNSSARAAGRAAGGSVNLGSGARAGLTSGAKRLTN